MNHTTARYTRRFSHLPTREQREISRNMATADTLATELSTIGQALSGVAHRVVSLLGKAVPRGSANKAA